MDADQHTIAEAKRRIKEAGNDLTILAAIDNELAGIAGIEARGLRFIIGSRKLQIKKETSSVSVKSFLARCSLTVPDERALFKYPLDDETFERLKAYLNRTGAHGFTSVGWEVSALFVLWCAHWFQRKYRGATAAGMTSLKRSMSISMITMLAASPKRASTYGDERSEETSLGNG